MTCSIQISWVQMNWTFFSAVPTQMPLPSLAKNWQAGERAIASSKSSRQPKPWFQSNWLDWMIRSGVDPCAYLVAMPIFRCQALTCMSVAYVASSGGDCYQSLPSHMSSAPISFSLQGRLPLTSHSSLERGDPDGNTPGSAGGGLRGATPPHTDLGPV